MNVVIDTNIVLSAALRDKLPERVVLHVARSDEYLWIVTPEIHAEYSNVLRRPKFKLNDERLKHWTELLETRTFNIGSPPACPDFPRDPKDAVFLAAALCGHADFLITGDKDLLEAGTIAPTRILTVAAFSQEFAIV